MSKDLLEKQVAEPLSWSREADLAFDLLFQIIVQKLQGGSANLLAVMGCQPDNELMYALLSTSFSMWNKSNHHRLVFVRKMVLSMPWWGEEPCY